MIYEASWLSRLTLDCNQETDQKKTTTTKKKNSKPGVMIKMDLWKIFCTYNVPENNLLQRTKYKIHYELCNGFCTKIHEEPLF